MKSECPNETLLNLLLLLSKNALLTSFIYLLHLFTQGKPKQLTLVFIGALHSFHS